VRTAADRVTQRKAGRRTWRDVWYHRGITLDRKPGSARAPNPLAADYGIDVPLIGAGMAFVALPRLVAAVSNAGGLGVLGASPLPPPHLLRMIRQTRGLTSKPFGVNLINARGFPGRLVPFTTGLHVAICARQRVPVVWFHWDLPPRRWIERLHRAGSRVWMQVGSAGDAGRAIELGVDAVIAQGTNAGGHSKATESLTDLLPQVVAAARGVPVLAAGGIATGEQVARAIDEGAAGVVVGTRLVASTEAYAHPAYKDRIVASNGMDTVKTTLFGPEWPRAAVRVLRNRVVSEWVGREDQVGFPPPRPLLIGRTKFAGLPYPMPKFSAMLPTPDTKGDLEEMALAAGESAGQVDEILPAGTIVRALTSEARLDRNRG
jgi:NAD(P)H-dependent flavin oxidoreductase YrpB (nitropropane dioxygenase family)